MDVLVIFRKLVVLIFILTIASQRRSYKAFCFCCIADNSPDYWHGNQKRVPITQYNASFKVCILKKWLFKNLSERLLHF